MAATDICWKNKRFMDTNKIRKIALINPCGNHHLGEIVYYALVRSFGMYQTVNSTTVDAIQYSGTVAINPDERLLELVGGKRKILALGHLSPGLQMALGVTAVNKQPFWDSLWDIYPGKHHDASNGTVQYVSDSQLVAYCPLRKRYLLRYDFEREWNNHGYGAIENEDDKWGISFRAEPSGSVQPIAWLADKSGETAGLYAGLIDFPDASVLWFNRPVGPVDSLEWRIIESYFSEYRDDELECFPYIQEIPNGYDGAACMHVDCDEAIYSAKALFRLYRQHDIPFSLAIKTGQEVTANDFAFLQQVLRTTGSVTSHSCNHLENWGGAPQVAYREAIESKHWLEANVTDGKPVQYAVSPFYQNPPFAIKALARAGYSGFIGGIICNDPEYLIGRAGQVPFSDGMMISQSQQCMVHGDCYHRYGNSIIPYIESFEYHIKAGSIFGYLDHPFSKRYSYGWLNETERLNVHTELIAHMKNYGHIWFANVDQCLDFLRKRSTASIWIDDDGILRSSGVHVQKKSLPDLSVSYRGTSIRLENDRKSYIQ